MTIKEADLGDTYWATTADAVGDDQSNGIVQLEIGQTQKAFDEELESATQSIQAEWCDRTGQGVDDLPDSPPKMLRTATAWLAASEIHQKFAQNISGENNGDSWHVFAEKRAYKKIDDWEKRQKLDDGGSSDQRASRQPAVQVRSGSLTDDII